MLSLETARKLKAAGLEWEPKFGDYYKIPVVFEDGMTEVMDIKQVMSYHKNPEEWEESINSFVYVPRLDQLLAEIEAKGYMVETDDPYYPDENKSPYSCYITCQNGVCGNEFWSITREEAAAEALLWILEQERRSSDE